MATNGGRRFTATIARVNDHGFTTVEQPAVWFNRSKFSADPDLVMPEPGEIVEVTLDSGGFVRAITAAAGTQPRIIRDAELGGVYDAPSAPQRLAARPASRDTTITRLTALKAAARFLADKPERTSGDVLIVAELFERWVNREEQP